ncbi:MAG: putative zinc-binding metallopeptidase [Planctomycetota bacterium]|nr:putative zinc-binding metallopeptidase [Planctomycetota bacterium]
MAAAPKRRRARGPTPAWSELGDEALLDTRLRDLGLDLHGSAVEPCLQKLDHDLERVGLRFRPYAWLSTDWFTPDGCTGFAIPFYLAHPRLKRLERSQMLEVEGGSADECLRILRHETAHAIDNAYHLRRRRRWRELFGSPTEPYDASYSPDPTSRAHVVNLGYWYSQSHPLEDWAETFAVWLGSGGRWRKRYAGWEALGKLEYVDELMCEVRERPPALRTRTREDSLPRLAMTLREYYERKHRTYSQEANPAFDGQLARVFPARSSGASGMRAATFLRKSRKALVRRVSHATGQNRYLLDHVVREMIERSTSHDLCLNSKAGDALVDAAVLLTSFSGHYLYGAHPRYQR